MAFTDIGWDRLPPWDQLIVTMLSAGVGAIIAMLLLKVLALASTRARCVSASRPSSPDLPNGQDDALSTAQDDESMGDSIKPPTVQIMVLGMEGSGKTMMMAGMYYRWVFGGRHGAVLRADDTTQKLLNGLMNRIVDPNAGLPEATRPGDVTRADFTFMVDTGTSGVCESFRLRYSDYAGERIRRLLLSNGDSSADPELLKDLADADILLAVLDGGEISRAMQGNARDDFAVVLGGMVSYLATVQRKTIHLVISKWDLLIDEDGNPYELRQVIKFLSTYPPYFQFDQFRPALGARRIIPVSTFGLNGFIRVDRNGKVRKNRVRTWQPFMVENAVACSVPDVLRTDFNCAMAAAKGDGRIEEKDVSLLLKLILVMLNGIVQAKGFDLSGITSKDLQAIWRALRNRVGIRLGGAPVRDRDLINSEANIRVLELFDESIRELELRFPESKRDRRDNNGDGSAEGWH